MVIPSKLSARLFLLWFFQGIAACIWLGFLPTSVEKSLIFGYSAARLVLAIVLLALSASSLFLWILSRRSVFSIPAKFIQPILILCLVITISAPAGILLLRALGITSAYVYSAYAQRLAPLAAWLCLSALELYITLAKQTKLFQPQDYAAKVETKKLLRYSLITLLVLGLIALFITISKIGITRYNDGSWGTPTTPLLEWQIMLALILSLSFLSLEKRWKWLKSERTTFLLIYLVTCLVWLSQPVNPGFFATAPRAPNFEIYPFSDAQIYAQYAQSALVGNGFLWPDVPTRPLYITFLTWLHFFAGQNYNQVILLQTLALAAFPGVIYLLGKEIAGRSFGLGLAALAILRDLTANSAAPFALNYTYTKLFFSEIPAALLISLFTLLVLRWVRTPKPIWYPLLAGGVLGLSSLIRLQSAVLLVAVVPLGFFIIKDRKKWFSGCVLMILGVSLAVMPWLVRNYRASGGLVLDNPISQSMVLARRWSGNNGNDMIPYLPGEDSAHYSSRMAGLALASLRENPARILGSAANHFFNNEIGNLFVFPLRDQLDSPGDLFSPTRAFWQTWTGNPSPGQMLVIFLYIIFLAVGLSEAYRRLGLLALLPLAICLVYNLWTALFLSSGDRFLVPVDWAISLYMFLGLFTISKLLITGITEVGSNMKTVSLSREQFSDYWTAAALKKIALVSCLILLCGASIPFTEAVFPQKYAAVNNSAAATQITLHGRAIYPRWYKAGDGEPGTAKLGYGKSDQARLVFFLVGEKNILVILPIQKAPKFFPNAADVTISGSLMENYLRADKIQVSLNGTTEEYAP